MYPWHHLHAALPVPYVPVRLHTVLWSHTVILMCLLESEHRSAAARTLFLFWVSLWSDPANLEFDGVWLSGFTSRANYFLLASAARSLFYLLLFLFSILSVYGLVLWVWTHGYSDWQLGCISPSPSLTLQILFNNNIVHLVYIIECCNNSLCKEQLVVNTSCVRPN